MPRAAFSQIVNRSMSEVLTRSLATLVLHAAADPRAAALRRRDAARTSPSRCWSACVSGAYSSIFIASPVLDALEGARAGLRAAAATRIAARASAASCPPTRPRRRRAGRRRAAGAASAAPRRRLTAPDEPERSVSREEFEELVARPRVDETRRHGAAPAAQTPRPSPSPSRRARDADGRPRGPEDLVHARTTKRATSRKRAAQPAPREAALMGMLAWVMMGLALWHFTIFLPDRFWGGIVGAFLGALFGAILFGLLVNGFTDPGRRTTRTSLHRARGASRARCIGMAVGVPRGRAPRARRAAARRSRLAERAEPAPRRRPAPAVPSARRAYGCRRAARRASTIAAVPDVAATRCALRARARRVASRSRRCSSAAASATRTRRGPGSRPTTSTTPSRVRGHRRRRSRSSCATSRPARGSPSTATTTSTASCSTAILVRALRALGADVDWYLPEPHRGRLRPVAPRRSSASPRAARSCWSPPTARSPPSRRSRCARALGLDVVVTDHHAPRADGALPDAPIVHPALVRLPVPGAVRGRRRLQARAGAARGRAARDPATLDADLDLVALATVADCVPLRGREPPPRARGPARAGARPRKPGPARAACASRRSTRRALDARAVGFRLAPRINAAGRLHRADAGARAAADRRRGARARRSPRSSTAPTPSAAHVEQRILFEAEAQVRRAGRAAGLRARRRGLAPGRDRDRRLADRRAPPPPGRADRARRRAAGTGSGRSIPGFDLLGGLRRLRGAPAALRRPPRRGRAARSTRARVDALPRRVRRARRGACSRPRTSSPVERVDAVVAGDELGLDAGRGARARSRRSASATRGVVAARPGGAPARPAADGGGQARALHRRVAAAARARAVAFGMRRRLPVERGRARRRDVHARASTSGTAPSSRGWCCATRRACDAGADRGRRRARPTGSAAVARRAPTRRRPAAQAAARDRRAGARRASSRPPRRRHRRHRSRALVATGEPVLVVVRRRRRRVARRSREPLGGFALCSLRRAGARPALADAYAHVVALDPPRTRRRGRCCAGAAGRMAHLAWGRA